METKIETYNQMRGKEVVDMMFDGKIFAEKITRDDLKAIEDLIAFEFQCKADSAKRWAKFNNRLPNPHQ